MADANRNARSSRPVPPWAWIWIPDDQGVLNVGGRIGASRGPEAVRRVFSRIGGWEDVKGALVKEVTVAGLGAEIRGNLESAARAVSETHRSTGTTVVVGGGHDHGWSQLQGVRATLPKGAKLGCIYLDAHLDVRPPSPEVSSGSPFYLALEEGTLEARHLVAFGIQPQSNSPSLRQYVEKKGVEVIPFQEVRTHEAAIARFREKLAELEAECDAIVLSLDLDCIAQAGAPGVSAPQAEGFDVRDVIAMVEIAAASPKCGSLGIFELNPIYDRDDATARIAATAAWRFIANRPR